MCEGFRIELTWIWLCQMTSVLFTPNIMFILVVHVRWPRFNAIGLGCAETFHLQPINPRMISVQTEMLFEDMKTFLHLLIGTARTSDSFTRHNEHAVNSAQKASQPLFCPQRRCTREEAPSAPDEPIIDQGSLHKLRAVPSPIHHFSMLH
jgi:hypothetical protein